MSVPVSSVSLEERFLGLRGQGSPLQLFEDLKQVLGGSPGGISIDTTNHLLRTRMPFVRSPDGSTCPDLEAVKPALARHGLAERVWFDEVASFDGELEDARQRVLRVLEPVTWVSSASVEIDGAGLLIRTANDLSVSQERTVKLAAQAGGVVARVEASLGAGRRTRALTAVQWTLISVGRDLRSLLVAFGNPGWPTLVATTVRESDDEIWIALEVPDTFGFDGITTADARAGYELVKLRSPVGGRRLSGPEDSPSWRGGPLWADLLPPAEPGLVVPRVVGLRPQDAERKIGAGRLTPRLSGGRQGQVIAQDPPAESVVPLDTVVTLKVADGVEAISA